MAVILHPGSYGPEVIELQKQLQQKGFDPGTLDGQYGDRTQAAVPALAQVNVPEAPGIAGVTVAIVSQLFPVTPVGNIKANLPSVLDALIALALTDHPMVLMALSTIRAETEGFEPIPEGKSRFNTSPNGHPFDLYDNRHDLGNTGVPDGGSFRGRSGHRY